jgi:imidazolonepropionase-like amidohydrolase
MPSHQAPGVCTPMGCAICDSPDAVRKEVRTQVSHGVSWIKVFADWPCRPTELNHPYQVRPTFLRDELMALVDEAAHRGRKVAAHATSDAGARQAIECGVASLEHMGDLSMETLSLAAERGVVLVPTLSVSKYSLDTAKTEHKENAARRYERVTRAFTTALASGVTIACGTDIGCFPYTQGSLQELALLCELGMKPIDALSSATRHAAKLLDRPDLGVLSEGAVADLCVFPLVSDTLDASMFKGRPRAVVQGGVLIRGTW